MNYVSDILQELLVEMPLVLCCSVKLTNLVSRSMDFLRLTVVAAPIRACTADC